MEPSSFKRAMLEHLLYTCGKDVSGATPIDMHQAMAHTVRDRLVHRWLATQRTYLVDDVKLAYYLSSEFLIGRSLGLCLVNMGIYEIAADMLAERGMDIAKVLDEEGDPGLGNGGLGRLAACFMDSLATLELPAVGYGIRYEYGIFEQGIENGYQVERRDDWLRNGNPWEIPRYELSCTVKFYGNVHLRHDETGRLRADWVDATEVMGLPYDSFIVGHQTNTVNTLRLWSARATRDFNLALFNAGDYRKAVEQKIDSENISKVLYPNDQTEEGKELRLKQQYFFAACSIADIIRHYKRRHKGFEEFPSKVAIHLNDTHPAIAVAELVRVLIDEENLEWDYAWSITNACSAYTNHTLLPEALEKWSVPLFERLLPRHAMIIQEINRRFLRTVQMRWPQEPQRLETMSLYQEGPVQHIRMAHLAVVGSHKVNGVAALHTELIKTDLLPDFYELWPERFVNQTNGVTPRRWLIYSNLPLSAAITRRIGSSWINGSLHDLAKLREFVDDETFLEELVQIKRENKRLLAKLIYQKLNIGVSSDSMFVVHIKRLHEYKRQLLMCLRIVALYLELHRNPELDIVPRTYIFAGKAAAGYHMAKLHIKLINDIADLINNDPLVEGRIKVIFMPNYNVSLAQSIIPAADLSVQISLAGKEASGTGNMKLSMNGALTLGTLDGANVEIREAVGAENFFLFGLTVEELRKLQHKGYHPSEYIARNGALAEAISVIETGLFSLDQPDRFRPVVASLRYHDPYFCCADFPAICEAENQAADLYAEPLAWSRKALLNIAGSGRFSSDDTVLGYAKEIWNLSPVKVDLGLLEGTFL